MAHPHLTPQSPLGGRGGPTTLRSGRRLMPSLSPRELLPSCWVLGWGGRVTRPGDHAAAWGETNLPMCPLHLLPWPGLAPAVP